jgi:beta-N-acetylhexosaminidase
MSPTAARLATVAAALAAGGCAVGVEQAPQPAARVASLSDAQLVGQRIVTGFRGTSPPAELRRLIRRGRVAGVILFSENLAGPDGARIARDLQRIQRPPELDDPLLVMVDQEGGAVERIPGPPSLSAAEMGAAGTSACEAEGVATGRLLAERGVNVDLAPVLDVARPGGAIAAEGRSFGADPALVGLCGEAFAAGLERAGVAPTAKHFPGLGAAQVNTDDAVSEIALPREELRRVDEAPFAEFIGAGAPKRLVMISSALYGSFDDRPASFSPRLAATELRERLGFAGPSITDALETATTDAFGGPLAAATAAARAGTDLLLFTDLGAARESAGALRELLRRDRRAFERSVGRVLVLRESLR